MGKEKKLKEKKKMKLWLKLTIIFSSIILGLGIVFGGAIGYFKIPVGKYYSASEKAFLIPGLGDGYIPQGLCYDDNTNNLILSGYMQKHTPSPIYVVTKSGELVKTIYLKTVNGADYIGHGGGIAVSNDFLYITASEDSCIYAYNYSDFVNAKNGDKLQCVGAFSTKTDTDKINSAFITIKNDRLIFGEFYRDGNYPTPDSHKITTKAGDYNQSLAIEYKLDSSCLLGINPTPIKAYSMPDKVQGFEINNGKIYLSTSWGLSFSHVYEYEENKLVKEKDISVLGHTLPLYSLDSSSLVNDYKIAPMSEEMAFIDGYLYVNCESASNKYIFGKFTGGNWMYKTDLSKMHR